MSAQPWQERRRQYAEESGKLAEVINIADFAANTRTAEHYRLVNPELFPDYQGADDSPKIAAERCTLEFAQKSARRLDSGKRPITDSPLFGGPAQDSLF